MAAGSLFYLGRWWLEKRRRESLENPSPQRHRDH
jgi:hypothetical protein